MSATPALVIPVQIRGVRVTRKVHNNAYLVAQGSFHCTRRGSECEGHGQDPPSGYAAKNYSHRRRKGGISSRPEAVSRIPTWLRPREAGVPRRRAPHPPDRPLPGRPLAGLAPPRLPKISTATPRRPMRSTATTPWWSSDRRPRGGRRDGARRSGNFSANSAWLQCAVLATTSSPDGHHRPARTGRPFQRRWVHSHPTPRRGRSPGQRGRHPGAAGTARLAWAAWFQPRLAVVRTPHPSTG